MACEGGKLLKSPHALEPLDHGPGSEDVNRFFVCRSVCVCACLFVCLFVAPAFPLIDMHLHFHSTIAFITSAVSYWSMFVNELLWFKRT